MILLPRTRPTSAGRTWQFSPGKDFTTSQFTLSEDLGHNQEAAGEEAAGEQAEIAGERLQETRQACGGEGGLQDLLPGRLHPQGGIRQGGLRQGRA